MNLEILKKEKEKKMNLEPFEHIFFSGKLVCMSIWWLLWKGNDPSN